MGVCVSVIAFFSLAVRFSASDEKSVNAELAHLLNPDLQLEPVLQSSGTKSSHNNAHFRNLKINAPHDRKTGL